MKRKIIKGRIIGAESIIFKEKKRKKIKGRIRGVQNILYSPSPFIPTGIQLFDIAQIISGYMNWQPDPNSFATIYTLAEGSSLPSGNRSKKTLLNYPYDIRGFVDGILLDRLNHFHPPNPIICVVDATRLIDEDNSGKWGWISYQDGPQNIEVLYYPAHNKWLANAFAHYPYSTTLDVNTSHITKTFSVKAVSSDTNQFVNFEYKIGIGFITQNSNPPWVHQYHQLTILGRPPNWANYYIITLEGNQVKYNNWISHNSNFTVNISGNLGELTHRSYSEMGFDKALQIKGQYKNNNGNIIREVIKNTISRWKAHSKILGWSTLSQVGPIEPATGYPQWWSSHTTPIPTISYDPNTTYHSSRVVEQSKNDIAVLVNDIDMTFSTSSPNTFTLHGIKRDGRFAIDFFNLATSPLFTYIYPPYLILFSGFLGKGIIQGQQIQVQYPFFLYGNTFYYTISSADFPNSKLPAKLFAFMHRFGLSPLGWVAYDFSQTIDQYVVFVNPGFHPVNNPVPFVGGYTKIGNNYFISFGRFCFRYSSDGNQTHSLTIADTHTNVKKKITFSWTATPGRTYPIPFWISVDNDNNLHIGLITIDDWSIASRIILIDFDLSSGIANVKIDNSLDGKRFIGFLPPFIHDNREGMPLVFYDRVRLITHYSGNVWYLTDWENHLPLIGLPYTEYPENSGEYVFNYSKLNNVRTYYGLDGTNTNFILISPGKDWNETIWGVGIRTNRNSSYWLEGPLFSFSAKAIQGQNEPFPTYQPPWFLYILPSTDIDLQPLPHTPTTTSFTPTHSSYTKGEFIQNFYSNNILKSYPPFQ